MFFIGNITLKFKLNSYQSFFQEKKLNVTPLYLYVLSKINNQNTSSL